MFALRDQLSAAMAERLNSVKEVLVRAEDARIIRQTLVNPIVAFLPRLIVIVIMPV